MEKNEISKITMCRIIGLMTFFIGFIVYGTYYFVSYASFNDTSDKNTLISGKVKINGSDLNFKIFIQNRDDLGNPIIDSYTNISYIPSDNYNYNNLKTVCTGNATIDDFNKDEKKFSVSSSGKGECSVYFDAINIVSLKDLRTIYIKENDNYETVYGIPEDLSNYTLNNDMSFCEGIYDMNITYNRLNINSEVGAKCSIYLDKMIIDTTNENSNNNEENNDFSNGINNTENRSDDI